MEGVETIARFDVGEETTTRGNGAGRILLAKTLQHGRVDARNGEKRILMAGVSSIVSKYVGLHFTYAHMCLNACVV